MESAWDGNPPLRRMISDQGAGLGGRTQGLLCPGANYLTAELQSSIISPGTMLHSHCVNNFELVVQKALNNFWGTAF